MGSGFADMSTATVQETSASSVSSTVWERRSPPSHLLSKRSQALFLLGLETGRRASVEDLRTAYRRAAMESHPDRMQNHARQDEAKELFQRIKEAFDYLSGNGWD